MKYFLVASYDEEFNQKSKITAWTVMFRYNLEIGRFNGLPEERRFCLLCDLSNTEDKVHVLLLIICSI